MKACSPTLLIFTLFLFSGNITAQTFLQDSTISISGMILSEKSKEPIENAIVTIKRTRRGVISDSAGVFHLQIQPKDTLVVSSMGYEIIQWPVPLIIDPDFPPFFKIHLKGQAVLLKEVDIYALGTWEEFKEDFVKTKTPPKKNMGEKYKLNEVQMMKIRQKELETTPPNIVAGLIGLGSKLFKRKRKAEPVFSDDINFLHQQMLQKKFNREIVADLTHESDSTLEKVFVFICKNSDFTYKDSEIHIQTKILELYEEYLQDPEKANSSILRLDSLNKIPNHLRP
ncbi:carboxypeptidase-like regulatory domain-containing protein [Marinifilum caeruleilacunae]|uniref:Carboxypeptidase-like regulatory domain-containing protein n=1 Tax=Marinifilum caeruleilacunae TaxID=2499076 RepID=A0ABX1WS43_9BACT|nr:carboxypeptidase-like regulatory domain-containing protein [Marinifilum caeruleilacunae]NOU58919.1 carboxypeptidase-like regulatory domain-containing protein [Marinifilum caeruleilacunae]